MAREGTGEGTGDRWPGEGTGEGTGEGGLRLKLPYLRDDFFFRNLTGTPPAIKTSIGHHITSDCKHQSAADSHRH